MNIDYLNFILENDFFSSLKKNQLINTNYKLDLSTIITLFNSIPFNKLLPFNPYNCLSQDWLFYANNYLNVYYNFLFKYNVGFLQYTISSNNSLTNYFNIF
jgi:hypothetical protein